ncbi:MAG: phosphate/phosphite/phosphonate ABC transporter substrate-binding protein [Desulfovibrionales bacterium]|nr:phosphate/phosphite/phosphonate ABC transporter substrate-binding protein [Desulfovibrionales bacterium]
MYRFSILLVSVVSLLFCLCACSESEPVVRVDMNKVETIAPSEYEHAITYAYLPQYSHSVSFERHRRLLEYLRHKTGLSIRQVFPDTFWEHIKMVERGEIDVSFTNPFTYITMANFGAEAFVRVVEKDHGADFSGQVIIRADNPEIQSLGDCRGKRIIAVDQDSAGGYLYPLGLFMEQGITRSDFQEITFASSSSGGKQEAVVLAVYAGAYDVGMIRKGTLEVTRDKVDLEQIKVLAESRPYPGWVFSVRKDFDPAIKGKIARALMELDYTQEDDARILEAAGMVKIIPTQDKDYESVRELVRTLGLERD